MAPHARPLAFTALALLGLLGAASQADAQQRGRGPDRAPRVGEAAPELALHPLGEDGEPDTRRTVRLSELRRERPVALVFGSYT